jgi:hypothetical protein
VRLHDIFLRPINLIGLVRLRLLTHYRRSRSSSMLISPAVVSIRVPGRKQLVHVAHGNIAARARELRKHNPSATPAQSFQPPIKLRRDAERGLPIGGGVQGTSPFH